MTMITRTLLVTLTLALLSPVVLADAEIELKAEILALDGRLFAAFNNRDIETMRALMSEDLEFYHDTAGLLNYEQNFRNTRSLFESDNDLRRELLEESTKVYPVPDYGAIQTGEHRFCHTSNGEPDCGVFRFLHIWQRTEDAWQITRVVSYGH